jgi:hypothetical protein
MFERLTRNLTYANVTATLALFIALGGSSYAALKLPRNSVGSKQIRSGAVTSRAVHDRSIRLRDVSVAARTSLSGGQGPAGPVGPPGPPAAKFFASVSSGGTLVRGNATSGGRETNVGTYSIGFGQSVSACAFAATLGTTDASTAPAGRITVNDQAGRVGVQTYDASGSPADLPFHLVVAC